MKELQSSPGQPAIKSGGIWGGVLSILSGVSVILVSLGIIPADFIGILGGLATGSGVLATWGRLTAKKQITSVLPKEGD